MADLRQSTNLALEIGLYRIALVVNGVFKQMKTIRPSRLFSMSAKATTTKLASRTFGGWSSAATN
jgi:hypothetical protein